MRRASAIGHADALKGKSGSMVRSHPMYVVPVKTVLEPGFRIVPHEELKAQGKLVVYEEETMEGKVIFCSHV